MLPPPRGDGSVSYSRVLASLPRRARSRPVLAAVRATASRLEKQWHAQTCFLPLARGFWRYSECDTGPSQGWKLHVAASILTASHVFSRVRVILEAHQCCFKVPARLIDLKQLNCGLQHFSQIGKFLTVYPRSTAEAVLLACELHDATRGLGAPEIPYDIRYRRSSIVFYRYGIFRRGASGASASPELLLDFRGKARRDRRSYGSSVPRGMRDPFQMSRRTVWRCQAPIGLDFLPFKALMQRGKGGVYEALDLSVVPARRVIIKEGHRHGETSWDGEDGYDRVRREARILRRLRRADVPVPEVLSEFTQNGHRYLVIEKIVSRPLFGRNRTQPAHSSWQRAQRFLNLMTPVLSRIHKAGWVWRDCKPEHIFLGQGRVRVIDFEGACKLSDTEVLPWSSPNYSPPSYCKPFARRRKGTLEDDYALGVIAFQLGTGKFPPADDRRRARCYKAEDCPGPLRTTIEALLRH